MNFTLRDLNLLRSLEALLRLRHVSRAASALGVSQPAMSRSLAMLRRGLGDALLVRVGGRYMLTPRAEILATELPAQLKQLEQVLAPTTFDPGTTRKSQRLGVLDYETWVLIPHVVDRLRRDAPGLRLDVVGGDTANLSHIIDGTLDLSIQSPRTPPQRCLRSVLFRDRFATIFPRALAPLDLNKFVAGDHVMVGTPDDDRSDIDLALEALGHTRRIVARVPYFTAAFRIASVAGLIFTGPARLIKSMPLPRAMAVGPPPTPLPRGAGPICLYWHERHHHDPLNRWLRQAIRAAAADLAKEPETDTLLDRP